MSKARLWLETPGYLEAQAARLAPLRSHLLRGVHIGRALRVLEVGCGTGAVTEELARRCPGRVIAVDVSAEAAAVAQGRVPRACCVCADGCRLPFTAEAFDIVAFAFTLMWARDPAAFVSEAARVATRGGHVVALAEPDYEHYDESPALLGAAIRRGIAVAGGHPGIGARLGECFTAAGLRAQTGVVDQDHARPETPTELAEMCALAACGVGEKEARRLADEVTQATAQGARRASVPLHWAIGAKP